MSQESAVSDVNIPPYILSVSTRDAGHETPEDPQLTEDLTYRTIATWLSIVEYLEKGTYKYTKGSVEQVYADYINEQAAKDTDAPKSEPFEFKEVFGKSRVEVWATFRGEKNPFHLCSDDNPQRAINVWLAHNKGIKRAKAKFAPEQSEQSADAPATPKNAPQPGNAMFTHEPQSNTPTAPQNAANANVGGFYTKKDAIAKLQPSDKFKMKIVQIEKHSKDGKDFYEFFEPYGGKAGQYSAASVFTDNEVALNNGLIAYLDTLGVKLGQALTGEWVVNCAVGKPKTKMFKGVEQTFTNIYVNSFEGQPETA